MSQKLARVGGHAVLLLRIVLILGFLGPGFLLPLLLFLLNIVAFVGALLIVVKTHLLGLFGTEFDDFYFLVARLGEVLIVLFVIRLLLGFGLLRGLVVLLALLLRRNIGHLFLY